MIVEIETSRLAKRLIIHLGLFVTGLVLIVSRKDVVLGLVGTCLFGFYGVLNLLWILLPPRLVIDDQGVAWTSALTRWSFTWSQMGAVRIAGRPRRIRISDRSGAEKTVPNIFTVSADGLLAMLHARLSADRDAPSEDGSIGTPPLISAPAAMPRPIAPVASALLAGILICVFWVEIEFPASLPTDRLTPSLLTLIVWGGVSRPLVFDQGELYRLLTAPLLHASFTHLFFNCFALVLAGRLLEGLIGRAWFCAIFVFGGLCGSVGSLIVNPSTLIGVGASGAIMALFATTLIACARFPRTYERTSLQARSLAVLLPTLVSTGKVDGGTIDFGAHIGGALGGTVAGLALFATWPDPHALPKFTRAAKVFGWLGAAAACLTVWPSIRYYDAAMARSDFIQPKDLPKSDHDFLDRSAWLVSRYPGDPRSHLARSLALTDQKTYADAIREARAGLSDPLVLRVHFAPFVETNLWIALALPLAAQGQDADALGALDKAVARTPDVVAPHAQRALVRLKQGLFDAALDDAKAVIALDPAKADGHKLAGSLWFAKSDLARAIDEDSQSLRRSPDDEGSLRERGLAEFLAGQIDPARFDLDRAITIVPTDHYAALWREIVSRRSGRDDASIDRDGKLDLSAWPGPAVRLFKGDLSPDDVVLAARSPDAETERNQTCEADFYIGEWDFIRHLDAPGVRMMSEADRVCPPSFTEASAARAELALHGASGHDGARPAP